jgi:UDP-glucose:tetrahydrobiopterin glucosyltransferase
LYTPPLKLLILSTPVAPLGSGGGGGVELHLYNIATELCCRGYQISVAAPAGSRLEKLDSVELVEIPGALQILAQTQSYGDPITMPANPVLGNLWDYAGRVQDDYDILLNLAYDWLPFFLTPFFRKPIAHFVSMGSLSAAMDDIIERVAKRYPNTISVCTRTQAETFSFADDCYLLGGGLDLTVYQFCEHPERDVLGWVGRISPEKGLEDAFAAAQETGMRLKIFGLIQAPDYWQNILATYPDVTYEYLGFLTTDALQAQLRTCAGLLVTPRWIEAFGNVAIEALACGVPVIAYRRGGLTEIVREGQSGWLVEPDRVSGLVHAIAQLSTLDRRQCRHQAEQEYSLAALGDRTEMWLKRILGMSV